MGFYREGTKYQFLCSGLPPHASGLQATQGLCQGAGLGVLVGIGVSRPWGYT